jgi:hypothetical protein
MNTATAESLGEIRGFFVERNIQIWVYRSAINPNLSEIRLAACEIPAV